MSRITTPLRNDFTIQDIHTIVCTNGEAGKRRDLYSWYCPKETKDCRPLSNITGVDIDYAAWFRTEVVKGQAFNSSTQELVYYSPRMEKFEIVEDHNTFDLAVSDALTYKQPILRFLIRDRGSTDGQEVLCNGRSATGGTPKPEPSPGSVRDSAALKRLNSAEASPAPHISKKAKFPGETGGLGPGQIIDLTGEGTGEGIGEGLRGDDASG